MAPIDTSKCYYCCRDLTVKDRSTWFDIERKDIKQTPMTFTSLYAASKVTRISNNAMRNACDKNNEKITRRKGEFARYKIEWYNICRRCDPSPPKKSKGEVGGSLYIFIIIIFYKFIFRGCFKNIPKSGGGSASIPVLKDRNCNSIFFLKDRSVILQIVI